MVEVELGMEMVGVDGGGEGWSRRRWMVGWRRRWWCLEKVTVVDVGEEVAGWRWCGGVEVVWWGGGGGL